MFGVLLYRDSGNNSGVVVKLVRLRGSGEMPGNLPSSSGDIGASLAQHGLSALFDEVVHITDGRSKAEFVHPGPSVFIDDSHGERKSVRTHCPSTLIADPNSFTHVALQ